MVAEPSKPSLAPANLAIDGSFIRANTNWEGYTATVGKTGERTNGSVGFPNNFRRRYFATSGHANRVNAAASDLSNFDSYAKAAFIGATARVHRVTNGVMNLVRTSTVTDAKIGRWNWLRFTTSGSADNRVIDGTSYRHTLDGFNRPNVPYWYRVAAVGADGLSGAWSAPVSYTPASVSGDANNVPNTPKAFNRTASGGALAAPTGLAAVAGNSARVASLTWNAVAGAEGYIVEQSFYDPATEIDAQPYLELSSDPTPILATDLIIIDKPLLTMDDSLYCSRIFGASKPLSPGVGMLWFDNEILKRDGNDWNYVPYSGDKPALALGNHFFRRTAAAGQLARMQFYWHSGTAQGFYRILKVGVTYRLRLVMRASSPVNVSFDPGGVTGVGNTTFNSVPSTWTEYTYDMVPTGQRTDSVASDWKLEFTAGGTPVNLDVAFFEIEETALPANPLAITPPATNSFIRDHRFIKPGPNNRLVEQMATQQEGLQRLHAACVQNNCEPWFQIEWNTPKEDLLNFVAYLAAPNGSHPMAAVRQASGIAQPWTTTFPIIKLELGNEAWNTIPEFWIFGSMTDSATAQGYNNGNVAGLFWQMMSNWMKESPYWSTLAPRLIQHAGGFAQNSFGEDAYRYYPDAKEVSVAAYNGGWDNGTELVSESGISFNGVLADPTIVQRPRAVARVNALKNLCASLGRNYGTDVRYTIYEGGPGYQFNGLNGVSVNTAQEIAQEVVMKSRAGAASTVDSMLIYAAEDFLGFNYFTLGRGGYWSSHAPEPEGGHEYLVHALPRIIHEQIAPAEVYVGLTGDIGTKNVTLSGGGTATINQIGAYQLRSKTTPSKRMIVLVNRNIDPSQLPVGDPLYNATPSGTVAFNVTTNWTSAASLKAWTAGIGPYRQHNRYPVGQRSGLTAGTYVSDPLCVTFDYSPTTLSVPSNIKNFPVNASVGAAAGGLPAGNVLILLFEGVTGS